MTSKGKTMRGVSHLDVNDDGEIDKAEAEKATLSRFARGDLTRDGVLDKRDLKKRADDSRSASRN